MDYIELTEIQLDAIIGILPSERTRPQAVVMEARLTVDLERCGEHGELSLGVDYAAVEAQLRALVEEGRFWLIETLALAACRWLLLRPEPVEDRGPLVSARIAIRKPDILDGRAVPGVVMQRTAPPVLPGPERDGVTVLVRTARDGAWRVVLAEGEHWLPGPDQGGLVVAGKVRRKRRTLAQGQRVTRVKDAPVTAVGGPVVLLVAGSPVEDRPLGA